MEKANRWPTGRFEIVEKKFTGIDSVYSCRFHPLKPKLACGLAGGVVCIFSGQSWSSPLSGWSEDHFQTPAKSEVVKIDWNVDGSQLAVGCKNGTVVIRSEDGTKTFEIEDHKEVTLLRWNREPGGAHFLASGHKNGKIIIWDLNRESIIDQSQRHKSDINDICWVGIDAFASCSCDRTILVHKVGKGVREKFSHITWVYSLRWNSGVQQLASCSFDGSLKIWKLNSATPLKDFRECKSEIYCLDWYQQSGTSKSLIACGCEAGEIIIWNMKDAEITKRLNEHKRYVTSVAFSPDGRYLASYDFGNVVNIWSTEDWKIISSCQMSASWTKFNALSWDSTGQKVACASQSLVIFFAM